MDANKMDYRQFLRTAFEKRCARNGRYSLRAFARDLGMSPAALSLVLACKQGLSLAAAQRIGKKLELGAEEQSLFSDLVESEHGRSSKKRELARIRLRRHDHPSSSLQLDVFKAMSDWYHFAILELTMVEGFKSDAQWIGRALGISATAAAFAIQRLIKLGLLEEVDGALRQTAGFLATPSGIPSDAIKQFHQQILKKAEEALYLQTVDERDFSNIVLPINTGDIPWAKARLKEFRREFMERLENTPVKDRVYNFSMQFFALQNQEQQSNIGAQS